VSVRFPPSANHQPRLPSLAAPVRRSIDREGRPEVRRLGMPRPRFGDVYHTLLSMSWTRLCLFVASTYVLVNVVFAALYLAQAGSIDNARPGSFLDHFYFSVQTMATIGYGKMTPVTDLANILVAIEALLGMLGIAMATGLIFAKFARTRPRVLFSRAVVVAPMDGKPALMFRLANERSTQIVEAQLSVTVLRDEVTKEGEHMRRLHELPLLRAHSGMFALSWSAIHIIDEKSPFHGATAESLAAINLELVVSMLGMEEVTGQTVHARHAYHWSDIRWDHRFVDIFAVDADGARTMDLGKFHEVVTTLPPDSRPG
jgi:inward rectifier potassium channel